MESSRRTNIVLKGSPKLPLQLDPQIERLLQNEKIELHKAQSLMIPLITTQRDILAISTPGLGVTTACVYRIMNALCLDATTEPGPKAIILPSFDLRPTPSLVSGHTQRLVCRTPLES